MTHSFKPSEIVNPSSSDAAFEANRRQREILHVVQALSELDEHQLKVVIDFLPKALRGRVHELSAESEERKTDGENEQK